VGGPSTNPNPNPNPDLNPNPNPNPNPNLHPHPNQAWGDRVLALSGKRRADPYRDATHATIGYWTDNGGYYHYSTGNGTQQAANGSYVYARSYEQVMPEVKASHDLTIT